MFRRSLKSLLNIYSLRKPLLYQFNRNLLIKTPASFFSKKKRNKNKNQKAMEPEEEIIEIPKTFEFKDVEQDFDEVLEDYQNQIKNIKIGKLTPDVFINIKIKAYGEQTTLLELGQIIPINATMLSFTPYDSSIKKDIVKSLSREDLYDFDIAEEKDKINISIPNIDTKERKKKVRGIIKEILRMCKLELRRRRSTKLKEYAKFKDKVGEDLMRKINQEIDDISKNTLKSMNEACEDKVRNLVA